MDQDLSERRRHVRKRVDLPAAYRTESGEEGQVRIADMSLGGAFIKTQAQMAFGTKLTLNVRLPKSDDALQLDAVVRWTKPAGIGVQFGALGARETYAITEHLADRELLFDKRTSRPPEQ